MGLFDKFKKRQATPDNDLPEMNAEPPTMAEAMQQSKQEKDEIRAREKAVQQNQTEEENEGLPSVNRKKNANQAVTIAGFVFIVLAAVAILYSMNDSDKDTKPKRRIADDKIANNLPPLVVPQAPPPVSTAPAVAAQGAGTPQPIGVAGATGAGAGTNSNGRSGQPQGKPVPDWTDRKMGGTLLVKQDGASGGSDAASGGPGQTVQVAASGLDADPSMQPGSPFASPGGQRGGGGGGGNELAAKLTPTITQGVSASMLPDRNFLITKGTTLDCALETALNSSQPGITTCRLTRDVYSDNGQIMLLDRGSQLVGEYQGGIRQGQVRLFVLWTRAKTPNGVVVALNSPGTDALGRSGLDGWVDNHFIERFGAAILMSFIKDTVTALVGRRNGGGGNTNVFGGSTTTGGERVVEKILESTVNIPPTIVKNQGEHIQVMVARDMDFSGVYGLRVKP